MVYFNLIEYNIEKLYSMYCIIKNQILNKNPNKI